MKQQIWEYHEADACVQAFREKKTVLVGGCFDLLHYGHYTFLKRAREQGDALFVALESDAYIHTRKNREPIHTARQRAALLSGFRFVDAVILLPYFSTDAGYIDMVKRLHPDVIAVTEGDPQTENKRKQIEAIGGRLVVVSPLLPEFATSRIATLLEL